MPFFFFVAKSRIIGAVLIEMFRSEAGVVAVVGEVVKEGGQAGLGLRGDKSLRKIGGHRLL